MTDTTLDQVREFHEKFGCHINEEPGFPELSMGDRAAIGVFAATLEQLAKDLKGTAADANTFGRPGLALMLIRLQLLTEEVEELAEAMANQDIVEACDALTDIQYVLDGCYHTLGLASVKQEAFAEVHRSNMSKLGADGHPLIHESGRVMKGPNYSPPDLKSVIEGRKGGA